MLSVITLLLGAVLASLAIVHVYWALGGRWALEGAVPTKEGEPLFEPGPLACLAVALGLMAAAGAVFWCGESLYLDLPNHLARWAVAFLAVLFFLRSVGDFRYVGFFKRHKGTLFARRDSRLYSPLCLVLSVLSASVGFLAP